MTEDGRFTLQPMFFPIRSRGQADLPRDASSYLGFARGDRPFPLQLCPTGPGAPDVARPAEFFFGERVLDVPAYVVSATLYPFSKLVGKSNGDAHAHLFFA